MPAQDLQITLTGKDVSASEAFAKLAKASRLASIEAARNLDDMGRKINESGAKAGDGFGSGLMSWAQTGLAGILGGVAASVTSTVTNIVAQGGQALMSELKSTVIDYNAQLENATIGFTTMLGSGSKATDFLNQLQAFAQRTPFQFGDLTQYAQQMLGYGIKSKDVIKDLSALGDAASGSGRLDTLGNAVLAFEQMAARGKVDLGDLNQLSNAGVPALKILASQYGVTTGQMLSMISTGKVMSSDALPKLTKGIEEGTKSTSKFGGMMDKQSGTFQGAMSNIQDSLSQTLSTAFRPFYKMVENVAVGLSKFATSKQIQTWAQDASKVVGNALKIISGALHSVFGDPAVQKSIGNLGKSLGDAFKAVGPAMKDIIPNLVQFGKAVLPAVIDAFTGIINEIPTLLDWWKRLSKDLANAGPTIAAVIGFLSDFGGTLFNISAAIGNFAASAAEHFGSFVADAQKRFTGLVDWIGGLVGQFTTIGNQLITGLGIGVENAWNGVMSTIHDLVNSIPVAVRKLLGIASPSKVFTQIGAWVGEGLQKGLLGSTTQVSAAATSLATAVRTSFADKQISKSVEQNALADIKTMTNANSQLAKLGKVRAAVLAREATLKSSKTDLSNSTKSATVGAGDVTGFGSTGDAVRGLQTLVANTRKFKTDLSTLVKDGIDQTTFGQLVSAWQSDPTAALASADGLLANPTDLRQIIGLQSQLASAGGALGSYAAGHEYDSRIRDSASKAKVLGWEMQSVARRDLQRVANETHVHLHLSGTYAGTKDDLAKTVTQAIRDAEKKGTISKNWAKG